MLESDFESKNRVYMIKVWEYMSCLQRFPASCGTGIAGRIVGPPSSNVPRTAGSSSQNHPKAETFNMTMKDAVHDSDMVAGKLPLNFIDTKVLIDSGVTRSFISKNLLINCMVKFIC